MANVMASVNVDTTDLSFAVASSSCSISKLVALIIVTTEATSAFCDFCDFESLVRTCAGIWFQISGLTLGVLNPLTFPGRGDFSILV